MLLCRPSDFLGMVLHGCTLQYKLLVSLAHCTRMTSGRQDLPAADATRSCQKGALYRCTLRAIWSTLDRRSTQSVVFTSGTYAGTKQVFDIVKAPSTRTQPPVMGTVDAHLALHAVHMDYIMRVHVTRWYGPTADHPGGWCKCYKGTPVETPLPDPPQKRAGTKRAREEETVRLWLTLVTPSTMLILTAHICRLVH